MAGDYCDRCDPEDRPVETSDIEGLKDIPGVCRTLVETNDLDDFSQGPLNLSGYGNPLFIVVNSSNQVNGNSPWYPNTITSYRLLHPQEAISGAGQSFATTLRISGSYR